MDKTEYKQYIKLNEIIKLKQRILEISYKYKLSHLSSCLGSLPIIYNIFINKNENEKFILSNGHSGLALYVILEHFFNYNAEELYLKHGIHPCFDPEHQIWCTTGSLGIGLPIAIGYALSTPYKICCLISDGECYEGSIWESLAFIKEYNILNININVIVNGLSAYKKININYLENRLLSFYEKIIIHKIENIKELPFSSGLDQHYHILSENEYFTARRLCENA
ncbi:MAG: hypothetical protein AABY32_02470 [Nanoarchaeota archaeon]